MFTNSDIPQIEKKGIHPSAIERQIDNFRKGFPFLKLLRPASIGDGIISLTEKKISEAGKLYLMKIQEGLQPVKFVPASGAASRMFQSLFSFWEAVLDNHMAETLLEHGHHKSVKHFFDHLSRFAFLKNLKRVLKG